MIKTKNYCTIAVKYISTSIYGSERAQQIMLTKHTLLYAISKLLPSLAGFVTLTVCSYYLSPEEVGKYNVIYASTLLINSLLFQWLRVTLARYFYKYDSTIQEQFISTIIYFCKVTLALSLVFATGAITLQPDNLIYYLLGFVWLTVFSVYDINLEIQRTTLNSKLYLRIELIKSVIHIFLSTALTIVFQNFIVIILSYIISQIIPLYLYKHNKLHVNGPTLNRNELINIIKYGFPLALMLSSSFINNTVDRILIAHYLTIKQAGLYSVGYDLFRQAMWMPFVIINLANFPILIKLYEEENFSQLSRKLKENIDFLLFITLTIGTLILINSNEIITIFIGKLYRETATQIMPFIIISTALYGISIFHFNYSFQFKKRTNKLAIIYIFGSLIKITFNVILLSKYGIIIAAQSTLITYITILILSLYLGNKEFALPKPNFLNTVYILLISFILYKLLSDSTFVNNYISLIIKSTICLITYFILLIKLNILNSKFNFKILKLIKN